MDSSLDSAFAVVVIVLGTSLFWVLVLWYAIGHFARITARVLTNQQTLEKYLWLSETAKDPHQAMAAANLSHAEAAAQAPPAAPRSPRSLHQEALMAQ